MKSRFTLHYNNAGFLDGIEYRGVTILQLNPESVINVDYAPLVIDILSGYKSGARQLHDLDSSVSKTKRNGGK